MSLAQRKPRLTPEAYLEIERAAEFRSEYFAGEMFAMAGGTPRHSLIAANVIGTLRTLLKGRRCTAYEGNLRIEASADGLYTYPDTSVFCEAMTFTDAKEDTATNPTLLVEVLSRTTEAYDRGKKFEHYRRLASLREYVLVAQDEPHIERFQREGDGRWVLTAMSGLDAVLRLESIEVDLPLAEVYEKVDFNAADGPPENAAGR
jgi:Uma2 family endonuclease